MMIQGSSVLAEATSKPLESLQEQLVVTIDKNNQVYINDFHVGSETSRKN